MQATPCSHQLFRSYHRLNSDLKGGDTPLVISAGLPNITGTFLGFDVYGDSSSLWTGAFEYGNKRNSVGEEVSVTGEIETTFDASRSNPIYGKVTTVQPPSISLIPQIKF